MEGLLNGFSAQVSYEGSKRGVGASLRIALPAHMRTLGGTFQAPGWLRMSINGSTPFFAFARRPPSRATVEVTLPAWCGLQIAQGDVVTVACESAEPYRVVDSLPVFDWRPHFVHGDYLLTTRGSTLLVHTRHEAPFEIARSPDTALTYRLLGLYQAEGSKSEDAPDFSLGNSNPHLLAHAVKLLGSWGLSPERLSLEVLREPGTRPAVARALFEPIGVEIVAERVRTGAGTHAATLHVRKSQPLLRAVKSALASVFDHGFPSQEAAREYALGWLDGDGSITHRGGSFDLVLAGHATEHAVMKHALTTAFAWAFERGSFHKNTDEGTRITLRAHEMLDLLEAGAFAVSMNLVRLLLAFDYRTDHICAVAASRRPPVGPLVRWGLFDREGELTARGKYVVDGRKRWADKIEKARQLKATAPHLFGVKCAPVPDGFYVENTKDFA